MVTPHKLLTTALFSLSQLAAFQTPTTTPPEKATLEGRVIHATTRAPITRATLFLEKSGATLTTTSGENGAFTFPNLDPGSYSLTAQRSGFLRQTYGARRSNILLRGYTTGQPPERLSITPGQQIKNLEFKLIPSATIAGRVLDDRGEPIDPVTIMALQRSFFRGKPRYIPRGGGLTNDVGEFGLSLAPGTYILSAHYRSPASNFAAAELPGDLPELELATTYYVASTHAATATPLELAAATELRGIDISMSKVETVRIRGRVPGLPPGARALIVLMPRGEHTVAFSDAGVQTRASDGVFELRSVPPGAYTLAASARFNQTSGAVAMPLEVGNHHIDNLILPLDDIAELSGTVTTTDTENPPTLQGITLTLEPIEINGLTIPRATTTAGGRFTFRDVPFDRYQLLIENAPPEAYLASQSEFDLTTAPETLEVTLSMAAAKIDGLVQDKDGAPIPGALVTLLPDSQRYPLYKTAATDQYGRFEIQGIAPGKYKLFAWEQIPPEAWLDPDYIKTAAPKTESLTLEKRDHRTLSLTAITSPLHLTKP